MNPAFVAACFGAFCVVMGAVGAHVTAGSESVKDLETAPELASLALVNWMTGVFMALIHLGLAWMVAQHGLTRLAWLLIVGAMCFAGSIWLKLAFGQAAVSSEALNMLVQVSRPLAPIGGMTLILCWVWLAIASWKTH